MPQSNSNCISVYAIRTAVFNPHDDLIKFLTSHLDGNIIDSTVVAVTSKIVSLAENRIVKKDSITKRELVRREADVYLCEGGYEVELTIKHGLLIPSAGIDESNSASGDYILFPVDPFASAARIGQALRKHFSTQNLGVIITDSHTTPLRRGVTGVSLAHWGLAATRDLAGAPDLFGRELKFTSVNMVDALAGMAVFAMGEADDRCPLGVINGAKCEFTDQSSADEIAIPPELDLYAPLLFPR